MGRKRLRDYLFEELQPQRVDSLKDEGKTIKTRRTFLDFLSGKIPSKIKVLEHFGMQFRSYIPGEREIVRTASDYFGDAGFKFRGYASNRHFYGNGKKHIAFYHKLTERYLEARVETDLPDASARHYGDKRESE